MDLSEDMWWRLVDRLAGDPAFLAGHLAGRSVEDLADALGAPSRAIVRLLVCRTPRRWRFSEDACAIAGRVGVDPARLAALVDDAGGPA